MPQLIIQNEYDLENYRWSESKEDTSNVRMLNDYFIGFALKILQLALLYTSFPSLIWSVAYPTPSAGIHNSLSYQNSLLNLRNQLLFLLPTILLSCFPGFLLQLEIERLNWLFYQNWIIERLLYSGPILSISWSTIHWMALVDVWLMARCFLFMWCLSDAFELIWEKITHIAEQLVDDDFQVVDPEFALSAASAVVICIWLCCIIQLGQSII